MKINSATNLRWANAEQTQIQMDVDFDEINDPTIPMIVSANYDTVDGRTLYANAIAGDYGAIGAYVAPPPPSAEYLRAEAIRARSAAVANIQVTTTAGNTFDGDETSQTRMARAIIGMQATGTTTINWTLTDNTVIQATVAELTEAMALAGAAQAAMWVV